MTNAIQSGLPTSFYSYQARTIPNGKPPTDLVPADKYNNLDEDSRCTCEGVIIITGADDSTGEGGAVIVDLTCDLNPLWKEA